MRPVNGSPLLRDRQDLIDLALKQSMNRRTTRREVFEGAQDTAPRPPPMDPVIRHTPQCGGPAMQKPFPDSVVNSFEDQVFHVGGDSRRDRSVQPQPDFPRTIANSIA